VIIYGKEIREKIQQQLQEEAKNIKLTLVVVHIGDDQPSEAYIRGIRKFAHETGVEVDVYSLSAGTKQEQAERIIRELNNDPDVNGIMLQKPLPEHLDGNLLTNLIDYHKDVEGIHNYNLGKLISRQEGVKPATPKAVVRMLKHNDIPIEGRKVTIVGRSTILGNPLSVMMTSENGTVTLCHTRTLDLINETRNADILVAALGKMNFITPDMVKEGGVIIDAGINFDANGKMFGDVHEEARAKASIASAVPGGVGVITVAELFDNLFILNRQMKK